MLIKLKNKYPVAWDILIAVLIFGFAFFLGQLYSIDRFEDSCNQFVVDNYYTQDMQRCLLYYGKSFTIPFGDFVNNSIISNSTLFLF